MQKIKKVIFIIAIVFTFMIAAGILRSSKAASTYTTKLKPKESISQGIRRLNCGSVKKWVHYKKGNVLKVTCDKKKIVKNKKVVQANQARKLTKKVKPKKTNIVRRGRIAYSRDFNRAEIEQKIYAKFGANAPAAIRVAACESGLNPNAIGDGYTAYPSYGVFQIRGLPGRPAPSLLLTADFNIDYAFRMSGGGVNWGAWTCKP